MVRVNFGCRVSLTAFLLRCRRINYLAVVEPNDGSSQTVSASANTRIERSFLAR